MKNKLYDLFLVQKPIIGMIHLAGNTSEEKVKRALEELIIYQEEGVDGAIIEDYHGDSNDVYETLKESSKLDLEIIRGVNLLRNPYLGFKLAYDFDARFVQFDSVQTKDLDLEKYQRQKLSYPNILVFGGVGFKYIGPTGNPLEKDLEEAKPRCEVIVTTGDATGSETPITKLQNYKKLLNDFPLITGAGVNLNNVYEQLNVADGAIIGSSFKPSTKDHPSGDTRLPVDRKKVRDGMDVVKEVRVNF